MTQYRTGQNIDAWCTRCKLVLAHTIEAIVSNTIKRVMCNTCEGKHQYRAQAPGTATRKLNNKTNNLAKPKTNSFAKLMSGKDMSKVVEYSLSKKFKIGELLSHKKFGVGVVVTQKDTQKIEVMFELGAKILIHDRSMGV